MRQLLLAAFTALAFAMPSGAITLAAAADADVPAPPPIVTGLTLLNGWTNAPFSTNVASVETINGIVRFQGAIATTGTNPVPFILPAAFRPATNVYVPVDLCNATNGRLFIEHNGTVTVQAETAFSNAQCFTSLDGASFVRNTTGFTGLSLLNSWTNAPFGTSNAAVRVVAGVVQFKGAIAGGTTGLAFTLPAGFLPATETYVPVDLCNSANGRLIIDPSGNVTVQAENSFSDAQCFTSLDGASFALPSTTFHPLTLRHGWTNAPFSTRNAAVRAISGVVHFEGAISTTLKNPVPFTLPTALRPTTDVYVKVDLCNATNGRLWIQPTGIVTVMAETAFSNAQCFTSLEGASFVQ